MAGGRIGLTDGALVERHLRGEPALEELYIRYHRKLLTHCRKITGGDRARAEDLAHDTLIRAVGRLDRFDSCRQILPWLKVMASRQAIDGARRRSHELLVDPGDRAAPDNARERVEDRAVLGIAFAQLSRRHREALGMRYLQDLDAAAAAERFDISRSAYEQLLARARSRLREEYRKLNKGLLVLLAPVSAAWRRARSTLGDAAVSQWARLDPSAAVSAIMGSTAASLSVAALVAVGGGGSLSDDAPPAASPVADVVSAGPISSASAGPAVESRAADDVRAVPSPGSDVASSPPVGADVVPSPGSSSESMPPASPGTSSIAAPPRSAPEAQVQFSSEPVGKETSDDGTEHYGNDGVNVSVDPDGADKPPPGDAQAPGGGDDAPDDDIAAGNDTTRLNCPPPEERGTMASLVCGTLDGLPAS